MIANIMLYTVITIIIGLMLNHCIIKVLEHYIQKKKK